MQITNIPQPVSASHANENKISANQNHPLFTGPLT